MHDEQLIKILGRKEKQLHKKVVTLAKDLWVNHTVDAATCELEEKMISAFPHLFI